MTSISRRVDPDGIAPPAASYAHATLTTDARRWLHTSGVVPVAPDGSVPESVADQAETVWSNIEVLLEDAGMGFDDVVAVTTYATPGQDLGAIMAARDRRFGSHLAASTLVIVAELVRPEWRLEVSVVAAAS